MAKQQFKIPVTLDSSYFDLEFNMKSKQGVGLEKPVTAKVILSTLILAFAWFYLVFQTFIGKGGIPTILGFTVAWVTLSVLLIKTDATGRMGIELVMSMINYIPKHGRHVATRMGDSVYPLQSLINIKTIDPEDGLITFLDGQIGYVYHVVGSASALMFEQDKQAILDKVDSFYKKLPVGVEIIYDTVYEGHVVDEQIAHLKQDTENLKSKSKGLHKLLNEQSVILEHVINNNAQGLTSLHQYLVVRSPNQALLIDFENLIYGDVKGSGLMFRLARTLTYEETKAYFKSVLCGISQ